MVGLLVFIMATLEKKKKKKGPFGDNVSKIRLDTTYCYHYLQ